MIDFFYTSLNCEKLLMFNFIFCYATFVAFNEFPLLIRDIGGKGLKDGGGPRMYVYVNMRVFTNLRKDTR